MSTSKHQSQRKQLRKEKKRREARVRRAEFERQRAITTDKYDDLMDTPIQVIKNPSGQIKMSEALLDLVRPYWDACHTHDAKHTLFTIGMAAWNASLMSESGRREMLADLAQSLPIDARDSFYNMVAPLIRRKQNMYPNVRRPIMSFEYTVLPSGEPYLEVLSALA